MTTGPDRPPLPLPEVPPLAPPAGFDAALGALGVTLAPEVVSRLGDYLARLLAMNEQMNLTAIKDPTEAWTRHVLDSLSLLPLMADIPAGARLLDVGSGGGVPGIPIALARPDLRVTLVDATHKKVVFLAAVAKALGLANVRAVSGRAEKLAETDLGHAFDVVTARAVAKLPMLLPWTAPFAKAGGRLLLIKGEHGDQELGEAQGLLRRYRCSHTRTVVTPTGRVLVLRVG
jgi:16S rRNA (guanine527-N7)-methyltransferase